MPGSDRPLKCVQGDENHSKGSGIKVGTKAGEVYPDFDIRAIMDPMGPIMRKSPAQSICCLPVFDHTH
jgi:hypothetical protein